MVSSCIFPINLGRIDTTYLIYAAVLPFFMVLFWVNLPTFIGERLGSDGLGEGGLGCEDGDDVSLFCIEAPILSSLWAEDSGWDV